MKGCPDASHPALDVSVMTLGDPPAVERMPRPRLMLRACPDTIKLLGRLGELLPLAGTPAREFLPAVGLALTMITGGLAVEADLTLSVGVWVLDADGRELARGTVIL